MKKIKICFIQTRAYSLFNKKYKSIHGGSELQLYLLAEMLAKNSNYEISFVLGDFGQPDILKINNIVLYKAFNPKSSDNLIKKIKHALLYYKLFKKIDADVYFTSSANSTVGVVSFFCNLNKKKHIHRTAHMMDVDKSYISKNNLTGYIYKLGLENSDVVLTQTDAHKGLLKENHNIDAVLFKNGFKVKDKKISRKNKINILWVARYEVWKRPEVFLKLSEEFKDFNFVMICNSKDSKKREWERLKEQAGRIKNLKFIEQVSFDEIQNFFNESLVFVNTSSNEGFPNTFIQAGIAGTPILSLKVNPDNIITEYDCGYCCDDDFDLMKNNLKKLMSDKADWGKKSNNVLNYVLKNHDLNKNILAFEKVLNSI